MKLLCYAVKIKKYDYISLKVTHLSLLYMCGYKEMCFDTSNNTIQSIKILISFMIMLIMMKTYLITIIQCVNKCILWNFYLPFKINTKCMQINKLKNNF